MKNKTDQWLPGFRTGDVILKGYRKVAFWGTVNCSDPDRGDGYIIHTCVKIQRTIYPTVNFPQW